MSTKPPACQACGHRTPALHRRLVDAPTPALREIAHRAGIAPVVLWVCDDAQECLRRLVDCP